MSDPSSADDWDGPPSFPGLVGYAERRVDLSAPGVVRTAGGCLFPERATDADLDTAALFRAAIIEDPWAAPPIASPVLPGQARSLALTIVPGDVGPRFLRWDWGADRLITRVAIRMAGEGQQNAGVAFPSSLGLIAAGDVPPAPEVPLAYLPLWADEDLHYVDIEPPLLARGVVFYPDELLDVADTEGLAPDAYPSLDLRHLEVYELYAISDASEGEETMPNPTVKRSRVGVQQVKIYPWNGAAGPYDATTACELLGLNELGISTAVTMATVVGGETVHPLGAHETGRMTKIKVTSAKCDLSALKVLLGGALVVDAASGELGEVQYHTQNVGDRAPYFRTIAKSTNGDGTDSFVLVKGKVEGTVGYNLAKDQVTNLEFEFTLFWDDTYVRQDGQTGGIYEQLFGAKGETALHS